MAGELGQRHRIGGDARGVLEDLAAAAGAEQAVEAVTQLQHPFAHLGGRGVTLLAQIAADLELMQVHVVGRGQVLAVRLEAFSEIELEVEQGDLVLARG